MSEPEPNPDLTEPAEVPVPDEVPEPVELADGCTVSIAVDTEHVGYSDNPAVPGPKTVIPFSVNVDHPSQNRATAEVDSLDEAKSLFATIVNLDKLGR